ncbi:MAG: phosphate acyltransferase PlsX [Clostridia bacterium]|nr:phosphate acyltransferase PlsX [Clostridia bacterium]
MRVIVDVMGGDNAPAELLKGVVAAAKMTNASYIVVGNEAVIREIATAEGLDLSRFDVIHTDTVITMEDDPLCVVRSKKNSSMSVGLSLLAEGRGDVFVSAGNTGALFTGATLIVRRVRGIQRAAIGSVLPATTPCLLIDSGANVTVTEEHLLQFAVMGSAYMQKMFALETPRVGLLNNGTEDCKGTPLQRVANTLLRACDMINYVGNVEGNAAPFGACDVLVTDGFTGNVFLKTMEGVAKLLLGSVKGVFTQNGLTKLSALLVKKSFGEMKKTFDTSEYGGAPFLGISRPVVKAHGSSDARAVKNAILAAIRYAESDVIYEIARAAEHFSAWRSAAQNIEKEPQRCEKEPFSAQEKNQKGEVT